MNVASHDERCIFVERPRRPARNAAEAVRVAMTLQLVDPLSPSATPEP